MKEEQSTQNVLQDMPKAFSAKEVEEKWSSEWMRMGYFSPYYSQNRPNVPSPYSPEGAFQHVETEGKPPPSLEGPTSLVYPLGGYPASGFIPPVFADNLADVQLMLDNAKSAERARFSIVMPPPNVTGKLHMGHALVTTLQDVIVRWKRMQGWDVLWVPGTDHAGISTQTVVERDLIEREGKRRADYTRADFLERVWNWKNSSETQIVNQLKKMGSSCDWSRQRFTMDAGNNRAVRVMFKKLYDDGLLYRGDYLVNWDPVTQTAISDDEVEYEDRMGSLWVIRYPLVDGPGCIFVATTRPETMLGDVAVAVSPKDPRYAQLIGHKVRLPLTQREIPILADNFVDPEFGTGAVKVTPAHDPNDYQMGLRHGLEFINIMTPDGRINQEGGRFAGMLMEDARKAVVEQLQAQGLLESIKPHPYRVGLSYRSKAVIEPYISKQWFIKMDGFKDSLTHAVSSGEVKIVPPHWDNVYFHWIDNLRDWCVSRQLWWGHRIPVWYHVDDPEKRICYDGEGVPEEVAREPAKWVQDEDVLDTWFSAGLWPFSTLGWPDETPEFKQFYPTSLLVTAHDILFFWVARMLFMGKYATGQWPFSTVFLHGLIYGKSYWREVKGGGISYVSYDERTAYELGAASPEGVFSKWEKMSKTKGNVVDPLELIDRYGTDAVRMTLCASATYARQIDLDLRRFEEYKNFANKVWNGSRFVFMNIQGDDPLTGEQFSEGLDEELLSLEDRWMLSLLGRTAIDVQDALTRYAFDAAATQSYAFFWKEFCAYYVELAKPVLMQKRGSPKERKNKQKLLVIALCHSLRLLHPMVPFITEELFSILKSLLPGIQYRLGVDPYTAECVIALQSEACMLAPYPKLLRQEDLNAKIEEDFALMEEVVYTIRNMRGEMKIPPHLATDVHFIAEGPEEAVKDLERVKANQNMIGSLVRVGEIHFHRDPFALPISSIGIVRGLQVLLPLPSEMKTQEKTRLSKERDKLLAQLLRVDQQLSNPSFLENANPEVLAKQKELQQQLCKQLEVIQNTLKVM